MPNDKIEQIPSRNSTYSFFCLTQLKNYYSTACENISEIRCVSYSYHICRRYFIEFFSRQIYILSLIRLSQAKKFLRGLNLNFRRLCTFIRAQELIARMSSFLTSSRIWQNRMYAAFNGNLIGNLPLIVVSSFFTLSISWEINFKLNLCQ